MKTTWSVACACLCLAACGNGGGGGGPDVPTIICDKGEWNSSATIHEEVTLNETYAGYTHIGGSVHISGDTFTNVDSLLCLEYVGRMLNVNANPLLVDLSGLRNVTEVGGALNIQENDALPDLDGLTGLTAIGTGSHDDPKYLQIYANDSLENVDGLIDVTTIADGLWIYDNPELSSLAGLDNLVSLGGDDFVITGNPKLSTCEAQDLYDRMVAAGFTGPDIIAGNGPCE
jgi:hypothetical protein